MSSVTEKKEREEVISSSLGKKKKPSPKKRETTQVYMVRSAYRREPVPREGKSGIILRRNGFPREGPVIGEAIRFFSQQKEVLRRRRRDFRAGM